MKSIQQQLLELTLQLQASGLNEGSSGNCSIRYSDGFYITPSGLNPKAMSIDDMVFMDFNGSIQSVQNPKREPSSEWRFHHDILKSRKDVNVVIHTHSTFATTLSLFRKDIPAFHYMIAVAGGNSIRCSPYELFGTQALSDAALKELLEALKHDRKGQWSIRINDQWRICFVWTDQGPAEVEIVDYH